MIEIHSKSDCPYCYQAKTYLIDAAIPFIEHVYDDTVARQALYDRLHLTGGQRTVPQVLFIHNGITEYIGGYHALITHDLKVRLQVENFDAEF
jgi:glutaredoxin